jgi:hypothetical protein
MDGRTFDDLTRRLARQRSRRAFLRGVGGGAAAFAGIRMGPALAAPDDRLDSCHGTNGDSCRSIGASALRAYRQATGGGSSSSSCPSGHVELENGSCAIKCEATSDCPANCDCGGILDGWGTDLEVCIDLSSVSSECDSTNQCAEGSACLDLNRCTTLC